MRLSTRRLRGSVRATLLIVLLLVACLASAQVRVERAASQSMAPAWVELGPNGVAIARAVTMTGVCPVMRLDDLVQPMRVRAQPDASQFPVLVCEAAIPPTTRIALVGTQVLPLPRLTPRRIVVIGDTGCRLKTGDPPQACNDPQAWPFAQMAQRAAAWRPDLVIHVGDLLYREDPCPAGDTGCAGSPFGYNWAAIDADFFTPAAPLLQAAPWVFVRGNHEVCARDGAAWFRFWDPRPMPATCQDYTDPYTIPVGDVQLLMLDASNAEDALDPSQVPIYAGQFAALARAATANAWLVMHRPLWAVTQKGHGPETLNETLQAASQNALPAGVQVVLSGHIHLFEQLSFTGGRPPQLVVGNSGTELEKHVPGELTGTAVAGATVARASVVHEFGYVTMEAIDIGWVATLREVQGGDSVVLVLVAQPRGAEPPTPTPCGQALPSRVAPAPSREGGGECSRLP